MFPYSGDISAAPSYNGTRQSLTGGTPAARRGDRGAVLMQDQLTSTASSPLQRMIAQAGFRGGVYGDNMITQQISSYVSSDPSEWSPGVGSTLLRSTIFGKKSTLLRSTLLKRVFLIKSKRVLFLKE